jgi:predicted transcriptional regulator
MTNDDITKAAAREMVRKGLATCAEIAQLSGRSRQVVRYWAADAAEKRGQYLADQWDRALKSAMRQRKPRAKR